jgi:hypothetical protein
MAGVLKPAKRPYSPPSFKVLDARAAKAELKARGEPKDSTVRQMFSKLQEFIAYDSFELVLVAIVIGGALIVAVAYVVVQR